MDGVAFSGGIHHLIDEEREAAGFILAHGVRTGEMTIKVFERGGLLAGFGRFFRDENFPAMACNGLFAFRDDVFQQVIAVFHRIGGASEISEIAGFERFELAIEPVESESANGILERFAPEVHIGWCCCWLRREERIEAKRSHGSVNSKWQMADHYGGGAVRRS